MSFLQCLIQPVIQTDDIFYCRIEAKSDIRFECHDSFFHCLLVTAVWIALKREHFIEISFLRRFFSSHCCGTMSFSHILRPSWQTYEKRCIFSPRLIKLLLVKLQLVQLAIEIYWQKMSVHVFVAILKAVFGSPQQIKVTRKLLKYGILPSQKVKSL